MRDLRFALGVALAWGLAATGLQAQALPGRAVLKGDYLGQPLPGETPMVFARGIVSTDDKEHWAPRFSPDGNEVFWWSIRQESDDKWLEYHRTMRRTGGEWSAPGKSPFDAAPVFSSDGNRLYFGSRKEGDDPWFVERQGDAWSGPKRINLVSRFPEVRSVYYPSITRGGTLYFMGHLERPGLKLGIYRSAFVNGEYAKPELLPPSINSPQAARNWTPFIAPDESYLIFSSTRGLPASDQGNLFVSFRRSDGSWTDPVDLGGPINTKELERFPAVSPDSRFLFFTRDTPGHDEDVYWVSTRILEKLAAKATPERHLVAGRQPESPSPLREREGKGDGAVERTSIRDMEPIAFGAPDKRRGLPVMEALSVRASTYDWSREEVSLQDLSDLLWAANGVNRPEDRMRTAPSAVNAQDVDIYVFLKRGVYLYDAGRHTLNPVSRADHRAKIDDMSPGSEPAALLVLVSDLSRFKVGTQEEKLEWAALDSGIVSQNISLFCAATGLGTRPRTDMNKTFLRDLLKLKTTQLPILNQAVGHPKAQGR